MALQNRGLSLNERLAFLGSLTFCIFMSGESRGWYNMRCFVQILCRAFQGLPLDGGHPELMTWTAAILRAAFGKGNLSARFARRLLVSTKSIRSKPDRTLQDLYSYFWDAPLSAALHASCGDESPFVDDENG